MLFESHHFNRLHTLLYDRISKTKPPTLEDSINSCLNCPQKNNRQTRRKNILKESGL
jgi:hypothetical protein